MIPYSSTGAARMGYGVVAAGIPIENLPAGATVARIRSRAGDFIIVYLRRGNSFERWHVDFADDAHTALRLLYPVACNQRPALTRPA